MKIISKIINISQIYALFSNASFVHNNAASTFFLGATVIFFFFHYTPNLHGWLALSPMYYDLSLGEYARTHAQQWVCISYTNTNK